MRDYDTSIKALEDRLASTMDQLNAARQRGAAAAVTWFREHGEELAEQAVIANPTHAKVMGQAGVSELKREIRALLQNADAEAAVLFRRVWDHNPGTPTSQPNRRSYLAAAERLVGRVGDLLHACGLLARPPGGVRAGWSTGYLTGASTHAVTELMWRFERVPPAIESAIDRYVELLKLAGEQQIELERLRTAKAQAEAKALWDQAE